MKTQHIYPLFLVLAFCTYCQGQNKTNFFSSETQVVVVPQAPNSIVRTVKQDRNENIWLASAKGIFKYDGKSFTNITYKVSSARFFSVLEDQKGNMWFGSIGSGVYYYDGKSFKNFTTKEGLAGNSITCIYEDKAGNIWFGTADGASRYDGKSFRNFRMKEGPNLNGGDSARVSDVSVQDREIFRHNDVNVIVEDKTGKLWFGTRGYLRIYDGKTFTTLTNQDGKPFTNVRSIIEDKKGNVWLGGNDGLWRYDGSTFTNFTQNFIGYIYEDKKGNIWTSSESPGRRGWVLSRYDEKSLTGNKPVAAEIMSTKDMLCGILEANDGSIWFGATYGVYRYDGKTITDFKSKADQQ